MFDSDPQLSSRVSRLLLDAPLDVINMMREETRLSRCLRSIPWASQKSTINVLTHYAAMGYILRANSEGVLPGEVSWDHPTPGNDILEWRHEGVTYKFRRTNDENAMPERSGHVRKSERHNADQIFLFEPETVVDATADVHWLICSGFQDGPRLTDMMQSRFFAWAAPFLASEHRMIGSRKTLFSGACEDLFAPEVDNSTGIEISKPILSQKAREEAVEEAFKKFAGQ